MSKVTHSFANHLLSCKDGLVQLLKPYQRLADQNGNHPRSSSFRWTNTTCTFWAKRKEVRATFLQESEEDSLDIKHALTGSEVLWERTMLSGNSSNDTGIKRDSVEIHSSHLPTIKDVFKIVDTFFPLTRDMSRHTVYPFGFDTWILPQCFSSWNLCNIKILGKEERSWSYCGHFLSFDMGHVIGSYGLSF